MKKLSILLVPLLVIALLLSAAGCGDDDEEATPTPTKTVMATATPEPTGMGYTGGKYTFKYSHVAAVNSPSHEMVEYMDERLQYYTDGQVKLEIFPMGTLYTDFEIFDALATGACDMASIPDYVPVLSGFTDYMVTWIPWYFGTGTDTVLEHDLAFIQHPEGGQKLLGELEQANIKGIDILPGYYMFIALTNKRELKTTDDLHGLKWQHVGGMTQLMVEYFEGVGVALSQEEVAVAFDQGLIDVYALTCGAIYQQKKYETAKYGYAFSTMVNNNSICMNLDLWDSLSAELQDIMKNKVMPEVLQWNLENLQPGELEALELIKQEGVIIHTQSTEERLAAREAVQAMPEAAAYMSMIDPDLIALVDELRP